MESFSQRHGYKPVKKTQLESMDQDLRTRLWNTLVQTYFKQVRGEIVSTEAPPLWEYSKQLLNMLMSLYDGYFKKSLDAFPAYWPYVRKEIEDYFFKCRWYEVYDFLEFVVNHYEKEGLNQEFIDYCNSVFEEEASAYRFIGGKIVPITSKTETKEIEGALENTTPLGGVNTHLKTALELMANRENPDYRNSIKESISAVEAICKLITKDENKKITLGQALNKIENEAIIDLHPALKKAFSALYGYANTEKGVRHGSPDEANISLEDAKFMLVSCSAVVNYLIVKADKAGIELQRTEEN